MPRMSKREADQHWNKKARDVRWQAQRQTPDVINRKRALAVLDNVYDREVLAAGSQVITGHISHGFDGTMWEVAPLEKWGLIVFDYSRRPHSYFQVTEEGEEWYYETTGKERL